MGWRRAGGGVCATRGAVRARVCMWCGSGICSVPRGWGNAERVLSLFWPGKDRRNVRGMGKQLVGRSLAGIVRYGERPRCTGLGRDEGREAFETRGMREGKTGTEGAMLPSRRYDAGEAGTHVPAIRWGKMQVQVLRSGAGCTHCC